MLILYSLCWLITICYCVFVLITWKLWNAIPSNHRTTQRSSAEITVSVIIPVRNEAATIGYLLEDLSQQNYPRNLFEVIVVDDCSDDETSAIVQRFSTLPDSNIRLLSMEEKASSSPKKRAISKAIQSATGALIMTTDGDCRVGKEWITAFVELHCTTDAQFISGPVTFNPEKTLADQLQTVEFSSLIATGAACIQAGYPTMCNGANLAYTKSVFTQVSGFDGFTQIASGDDEFLLHKVKKQYPNGVAFIKDQRAIVQTNAHQTWKGFYNQRKRWASKWQYYQTSTPKIMAAFVFFSNAILPLTLILTLVGILPFGVTCAIWLVKCLPEWLLISTTLRFLKKSKSIVFIPFVQLLYPWYVILFGLSNNSTKTYLWKGRELQ